MRSKNKKRVTFATLLDTLKNVSIFFSRFFQTKINGGYKRTIRA